MSQEPIFMPTEMEWKHPHPECSHVEVSVCTIYDSHEEADADYPIALRITGGHEDEFNCEQAIALAHALLKAVDVLKMQCLANAAREKLIHPTPPTSGTEGK